MVSGHVKTQLIAHDKEVYDIAFSKAGGGRDMFASVGADGKWISTELIQNEISKKLSNQNDRKTGCLKGCSCY
jgi:hypothetical protein